MAIHPIDLTGVYSQMDKVAKYNASQGQNAQIASQVNQAHTEQQNLQKSQSVRQISKPQTEEEGVKNNAQGSSRQAGQDGDARRQDREQEDSPAPKYAEITDPALGRHIDITR